VAQPDQARLPLGVRRRLLELSKLASVAIITGRSLADIRPRLEFEPDYTVGNHGIEGIPGWEGRSESYERLCLEWGKKLCESLQDETRYEGVQVENKQYSLSVHYRLARDHKKIEQKLLELFGSISPPFRVVPGKCVFNLIPPDAVNKGNALERLMQVSNASSAIYIGDDFTDEDVFALKRKDLMSIRIGITSCSAAKFFIAYRAEVMQVLDDLIRRLRML